MLGERLHTAATAGIPMETETTDESRYYWKRIANALVDFFGNMGGDNPITFKCGDSVFTITATSITATHKQSQQVIDQSGIGTKLGDSALKVESTAITVQKGAAMRIIT